MKNITNVDQAVAVFAAVERIQRTLRRIDRLEQRVRDEHAERVILQAFEDANESILRRILTRSMTDCS